MFEGRRYVRTRFPIDQKDAKCSRHCDRRVPSELLQQEVRREESHLRLKSEVVSIEIEGMKQREIRCSRVQKRASG